MARDEHHEDAKRIFRATAWPQEGVVLTNTLVISELFTLANARTNANNAVTEDFMKLVRGNDNFFKILQHSVDEMKKIVEIMEKYSTKERILSVVDASLIFLACSFEPVKVATFDEHFKGLVTILGEDSQ
jgi:predicted nucleic acid-binding protein